jgi:hypothetical protein
MHIDISYKTREKNKGKQLIGRTRVGWENEINMILTEYSARKWNGFVGFNIGSAGSDEWQINSLLGDNYLLKKNPGVWS